MAELVARFDWSTTPLGSIDGWPQSLKTAVDLMLGSGHAMQLAWGPERTVLYNDAYRPMLGDHHPAALGLPFREAWPDVWDEIEPLVAQVFAGQTVRFEDMPLIMHRSGYAEETWWNFSYSPVRGESGEVAGLLNVTVDATAKMKALRAERERDEANVRVRESEQRLRALVNASSDVVYTMSADWTEMRQLHGRDFLSNTEAPTIKWIDKYLYDEDKDAIDAVIRRAVSDKSVFELEHRVRNAENGGGWTFSRAVPILGVDGEIVEWFGMAADVTSRHDIDSLSQFLLKLSDTLRAASSEQEIAESAIALVANELNLDRCYITHMDLATDCAEVIHEMRREHLAAVPPRLRLSDFPAVVQLALQHTLVFDDLATDDRLTQADHDSFATMRFGALLGAPLRMGEGQPIWCMAAVSETPRHWRAGEIALIEESAERIWSAIQRARSEKALRESDRKKDEFLAMLAHELRNPIAAIRNASYVLSLQPDQEMAERSSAVIERQVLQLGDLVDDLLDVSRITRGLVTLNRVPCEMQTIVRNAVESLRPMIEAKAHELEVTLSHRPRFVFGDPVRIEQIVVNLVANAIKYTDPGGHIEVLVGVEGQSVRLTVRDNGIGMSQDIIESAFDLFAQAERGLARSQGGLGVGLTIVKQLADLHGGTVRASSDGPGTGSVFVVTFPMIEPDTVGPRETPEPTGSAKRGRRILVVDDRPDSVSTLADLLRMHGNEVCTETSGAAALARVFAWHPEVVLLDLGLPDIDGFEVAQRIRANDYAPTRLAAISGYGQPEDIERARSAGFDRHFIKPVDVEGLLAWLRAECAEAP